MPARRYIIRGRVQGVGFRNFTQRCAVKLGLTGWVRNLDDGNVEAFACGPASKLSDLEGLLHKGPMLADVRGVEWREASEDASTGFVIR